MFAIQKAISKYGDVFIAPALILIGLFMLLGNRLNLPKFGFSAGDKTQTLKGSWGSLLLGALFALAFCPTSGVFYFGMLMPMAAAETGGYLLPVVFALATGLPVIVVAWILAYSIAGLGKFYNRIQVFQKWFNRVVAVLVLLSFAASYASLHLPLLAGLSAGTRTILLTVALAGGAAWLFPAPASGALDGGKEAGRDGA